jgi:hypothetical protein
MLDAALFDKVSKLPDNLKAEVSDFVEFLLQKYNDSSETATPTFGSGKGMFLIKPGFDEPLEDFKEYM